ncbi:MAG: GDSL-type esterase/lipase family protein [Armatimonadota bacterium]
MSDQWEPAITAFEERDRQSPPCEGAMLFTGSSTIVKWETLAQDFPFAPVLNRGFGGSEVPDLLEYLDRVIVAYRPHVVVVYSGDNDLARRRSPRKVLDDFATLQARIHAALPETALVIVGLKPSPNRWALADAMREVNDGLAEWARAICRAEVVDVWDEMLGDDGLPRPDLYSDGLHLTPEGYRVWTERLSPRLKALWANGAQR